MQNNLQKVESCNNSSQVVDIFLRLKLDLVEKEIMYYQEVQLETVEEKSRTLQREIERLENRQNKIMHVLMDKNHHKENYWEKKRNCGEFCRECGETSCQSAYK